MAVPPPPGGGLACFFSSLIQWSWKEKHIVTLLYTSEVQPISDLIGQILYPFSDHNIKNISKHIIFAPHRKLYSEVFPGGYAIFSRARDEQDQDLFFYFSTVTCNFQLKREIMIYLGSTARWDTKEDGGITIAVGQILTAYITVENIVANTAME